MTDLLVHVAAAFQEAVDERRLRVATAGGYRGVADTAAEKLEEDREVAALEELREQREQRTK